MIKAKVTLNNANIAKIENAMKKAMTPLLMATVTEINNRQVVPKDTGALEESVMTGVSENRAFISYNTVYARKLYYNPQFNFRTDRNVNAQGRWMDYWIFGEGKEWLANTYGVFIMQQAGGVIK